MKIDFKNSIPVFLAPMAGITDPPFRKIVSDFGATAVVSEMVSSEAMIRENKKTYKRTQNNDDHIRIVQIVGYNPKNMAESAIINESLGVDMIDINAGCPARKVVSNGSGAALMKNENLALKIVESVVKAVKIPVTLKMRLGWDSENINCLSLCKKFEDCGVRMVSIHCRTRSQMYSGKADWPAIKRLADIIKIPYLCNGDIKSGTDAKQAVMESNACGVMIGRASLGRPWLLRKIMDYLKYDKIICNPSIQDQFNVVMRHFENVLDFYGKINGVKIFRKHLCWYSKGLCESSKFREEINNSEDIRFIKNYIEDFYAKCFHATIQDI